MQSFFVAVNNLLKNFYRSTRRQLHRNHEPSPTTQPPANPHHSYFSTAPTTPPQPSFRRRVVQRGANYR
ncbi:hypothetical protein AB0305_22455, partial [Arthrobacter sp. NPDC080086]|uniref:hypothetical protein n=1 Tax=Arthrobacter sp. NPDC080086 TaxID=3155917 RepID=UPI00344D8ED3